jgi:hypothetical protein
MAIDFLDTATRIGGGDPHQIGIATPSAPGFIHARIEQLFTRHGLTSDERKGESKLPAHCGKRKEQKSSDDDVFAAMEDQDIFDGVEEQSVETHSGSQSQSRVDVPQGRCGPLNHAVSLTVSSSAVLSECEPLRKRCGLDSYVGRSTKSQCRFHSIDDSDNLSRVSTPQKKRSAARFQAGRTSCDSTVGDVIGRPSRHQAKDKGDKAGESQRPDEGRNKPGNTRRDRLKEGPGKGRGKNRGQEEARLRIEIRKEKNKQRQRDLRGESDWESAS